jgi:hypothetical protein
LPRPWALASGQPDNGGSVGPAADLWVVTANLLFLLSIASSAGTEHPTVVANRELEPETTGIVLDLMADGWQHPRGPGIGRWLRRWRPAGTASRLPPRPAAGAWASPGPRRIPSA